MAEKNINRLIQTARGDRPADLLLQNARLVNVYLGAVQETDIAVSDGYVVGFGSYDAVATVDLQGRYVAPGFIDAHVHIESAMTSPAQFARAVLPTGTTAVVADPHEIANVLGTQGIAYMLAAAQNLPLHIYFALPSCVPATAMETSGAVLTAADLKPFMGHPRVKALAEMMNFPGVIYEDPDVLAKIQAMQGFAKPLDGHSPGLRGKLLNAYLVPGIASDHECTDLDEAREKLAAGMHIMVREGTGARNLMDLLPLITPETARRMMWCTDDRHPHDLLGEGHINSIVRRAVQGGLDPITAIVMATLNPAEYFRLEEIGAVAPGKRADFVVFDDLNDPHISQVYFAGALAAENGILSSHLLFTPTPVPPVAVRVPVDTLDFSVPAQTESIRVIQVVPGQIVTGQTVEKAAVRDGRVVSNMVRDILKIVVVERYQGTGHTGVGFIHGFGLKKGALASTVAHDSHNIIAVGVEDRDLHLAVRTLVAMGGGLTAVADGTMLARVPLPIAGLMSDQPVEQVRTQLDELIAAARDLGTALPDPFITLSFMALPVIPKLKLTDKGLVDVEKFEVVSLFV